VVYHPVGEAGMLKIRPRTEIYIIGLPDPNRDVPCKRVPRIPITRRGIVSVGVSLVMFKIRIDLISLAKNEISGRKSFSSRPLLTYFLHIG